MKPKAFVWLYNSPVAGIQQKFSTQAYKVHVRLSCSPPAVTLKCVPEFEAYHECCTENTKLWDISPLGVHAVLMSL